MGKREQNLFKLLEQMDLYPNTKLLDYPQKVDFQNTEYLNEVQSVYKRLGGTLDTFPVNLRNWDIVIGDIAIELNETLHFNRYRSLTFQSELYELLPNFPIKEYRKYCNYHEKKCIKTGCYGGKWTNSSCENQFSPADPPKTFTKDGSPRWKQRAFYDFIKDLAPLIINVPVVRISIYDFVFYKNHRFYIDDILDNYIVD
jgi:hypothetical protein